MKLSSIIFTIANYIISLGVKFMIWWITFICALIIPSVMLCCGLFMWKRPPRKINAFIGYRTTKSMKNEETWKYAHNFCGKLWSAIGAATLMISAAAIGPFYNASEKTVAIVALVTGITQFAVLLTSLIPTEIALKLTFDNDGIKKQ